MATHQAAEMYTLWISRGLQVGDVTIRRVAKTLLRVEHTDVWVPGSFTVRFDRVRLPLIDLDIEYLQHERFICRDVRLHARVDKELSPKDLALPLTDLVEEAVERVAYREVELRDRDMALFARAVLRELAEPPDAGVTPRKIRVGDTFRFPLVVLLVTLDPSSYETYVGNPLRAKLRAANHARRRSGSDERTASHLRVALEYQRARKAGESTSLTLAQTFQWSPGRAANAISQARKAGYHLPPARPA